MSPKKLGKALLCRLLERQVKRLRSRNDFKLIAIAGSVGKTSTKLAIAQTLTYRQKVIYQDGNYNDRLTVPLVLFGHDQPNIFNVFAWLKILRANEKIIRKAYPYDLAVLEIGTDAPGQLARFAYLRPEMVVLTAIAAEHMQFFGTLDAVAKEELIPLTFSKQALLNIDNIPADYLPQTSFTSYGSQKTANYRLVKAHQEQLQDQQLEFGLPDGTVLTVKSSLLGKQGAKALLAAAAIANILKWPARDIKAGLEHIKPVPGRMQVLDGIQQTSLIDDTYNASPLAVQAALDVLYSVDAPQRIAILGTMNELGDYAEAGHQEVGAYCDPKKLDLVVTIGADAEQYLAPAARSVGCTVASFSDPYAAGEHVKKHLQSKAVVLAKGSQNGVFAEETLKTLLTNPEDANQLVRQTTYWLAVKRRQFPST